IFITAPRPAAGESARELPSMRHPSSASHYRGPTSPQEHVVAEWLYRNLDVAGLSERAYCVSMPIDNLILQGSASAGKPGRQIGIFITAPRPAAGESARELPSMRHPSSASHYRGPTSPQEHVVAEWLYRNLDVAGLSERAYCVSMPIDNLILQGSASAGKPGR